MNMMLLCMVLTYAYLLRYPLAFSHLGLYLRLPLIWACSVWKHHKRTMPRLDRCIAYADKMSVTQSTGIHRAYTKFDIIHYPVIDGISEISCGWQLIASMARIQMNELHV